MISTKGRYAICVMLDLAEHAGEGYVPLKSIAERQEVSKKYLEIIVKDLVRGGLLTGVSGKGGGYKLCRDPKDYTVGEVLELMEGSLAPVACLAKGGTLPLRRSAPPLSVGLTRSLREASPEPRALRSRPFGFALRNPLYF